MWGAIVQAIDNAAGRMNKGAAAGIEVAKSQNGGAADSANNTTDTTVFGKSLKTVVSKIKDTIKDNQNKEEENGTEETEGTI